jgi:hypothetical protein
MIYCGVCRRCEILEMVNSFCFDDIRIVSKSIGIITIVFY